MPETGTSFILLDPPPEYVFNRSATFIAIPSGVPCVILCKAVGPSVSEGSLTDPSGFRASPYLYVGRYGSAIPSTASEKPLTVFPKPVVTFPLKRAEVPVPRSFCASVKASSLTIRFSLI